MSNNSAELIGKIYKSRFQYFDNISSSVKFKRRPVLIIGVEKETLPCDITILPISKISVQHNIDGEYDYKVTKQNHENLNLDYDPSYIRTHKISTIYSRDLVDQGEISSMKDAYADDYQSIKEKVEKFASELF